MTKQLPNELTKYNVSEWIKKNKDLGSWSTEAIDTSNISKIDSAGIALLIELKQKYQFNYINISQVVSRLASLYQIKL